MQEINLLQNHFFLLLMTFLLNSLFGLSDKTTFYDGFCTFISFIEISFAISYRTPTIKTAQLYLLKILDHDILFYLSILFYIIYLESRDGKEKPGFIPISVRI